jgi:hypothetical protein
MTSRGSNKSTQKKNLWRFENGKIYFSRSAEQRFFFALTVIMLLAGILYKLGLLN